MIPLNVIILTQTPHFRNFNEFETNLSNKRKKGSVNKPISISYLILTRNNRIRRSLSNVSLLTFGSVGNVFVQ